MPLSNSEKQARFRKKAELERLGNEVRQLWQANCEDPQYLRAVTTRIDRLVELPSGWSEGDWNRRKDALLRQRLLAIGTSPGGDELGAEIVEKYCLNLDLEGPTAALAARAEMQRVRQSTIELRQHLVSAIALADELPADPSIAVLALVREVGVALQGEEDPLPGESAAICMTAVSVEFARPDWVLPELAAWLRRRLTDEDREALATILCEGE